MVGELVGHAPVAGLAFGGEVVHDQGQGEGAAHHEGLAELEAQTLYGRIKPIPIVNHIKHKVALLHKRHHLLPVRDSTALKPHQLRASHIMELGILNTRLHLRRPNILQTIHELSVEVVQVDLVVVHDDDFLDAQSQQVHDHDGAEAAGSQAQDGLFAEEVLVPLLDAGLAVEDGPDVFGVQVQAFFH